MLAAAASSRTISPRVAYILIVVFSGLGPLIVGTAVARTIGSGIADFHQVGLTPLVAAIVGALAAVGASYAASAPTSMSVALVAAMIGSLWAGPGIAGIHWSGVIAVGISMVGSVIVGAVSGALAYALVVALLKRVRRPAADRLLRLQYATVALMALGYGANDLEKSVGLFAAATAPATFSVPLWTLAVSILCFALGMAFGGVRVARTVGGKLFSIRPHHALAFQLASSVTVIGAAHFGGPLSTTQTAAAAIVGAGAAADPRAIRWQVVRNIALSWGATIPLALAAGALVEFIAAHR
jgi:inorganic phosphate transporter, PiT family